MKRFLLAVDYLTFALCVYCVGTGKDPFIMAGLGAWVGWDIINSELLA